MKKKIILKLIVVLVTIGIIYEGYGMIKEFTVSSRNLEEINTKDLSSNDKSIAIVLQNEDDSWEEATDRSKWPSKEDYGYMGAECTDSDGAKIDVSTILKFDIMTYHATIDTKNSIYCTLYFAKGEPALQKLQETGGEVFAGGGDHTTAVDGMYRYKGTTTAVNNNYICFGTSNKDECLANPDTYMFRIIGITSADDNTVGLKKGQLKIIKATPSNTSQKWGNREDDSSPWDSSQAKNHVTSWYNTNISGKQPNGTYWDSIVTSQKWYNADQTSTPGTVEPKTSQSAASKVALMYGTDFTNASTGTSSWLFIKNGMTGSPSSNEWTMTRYGLNDRRYWAWYVLTDGRLTYWYVDGTYAVRPVLYLQSAINLTGTGKSDDPFRIRSMNNVQ